MTEKVDDLYHPDILKEMDYPQEEWLAELELLQQEIKNKIDLKAIYLIEDEGIMPIHKIRKEIKKGQVVGVYSPYYSRMMFHPDRTNENQSRTELTKFI